MKTCIVRHGWQRLPITCMFGFWLISVIVQSRHTQICAHCQLCGDINNMVVFVSTLEIKCVCGYVFLSCIAFILKGDIIRNLYTAPFLWPSAKAQHSHQCLRTSLFCVLISCFPVFPSVMSLFLLIFVLYSCPLSLISATFLFVNLLSSFPVFSSIYSPPFITRNCSLIMFYLWVRETFRMNTRNRSKH